MIVRFLTVICCLLPGLAIPGPATGTVATLPFVNVRDARGDVTIRSRPEQLSQAQLVSIDLRRVEVERRGDSTRFTFFLHDLLPPRGFDQMVFVELLPPRGSGSSWRGDLGMGTRFPELGFAYYAPDTTSEDITSCDPLTAKLLWRRDAMRLTVPVRCLPPHSARMRVRTMTGYFRSDAGTWSVDTLRVPSRHVFG